MSEHLSQAEVDALLRGMAEGEVELPGEEEPVGAVRPYNLVGEEASVGRRFPALFLIHERLARNLRLSFAATFGGSPSVEISALEMLRFGILRNRLEGGAALNLFTMAPLRGQAILVIGPSLAFQMVDRLFGGSGRPPEILEPREYSPIELQVLQRIVRRILEDLSEAWGSVLPIHCELVRTETNPHLATLTATEDMVLRTELTCDLGAGPVKLAFAIPYASLEPVRSRLGEPRSTMSRADGEWVEAMRMAIEESEIELVAELGARSLSTREVLGLKVGDVIALESRAGEPLGVSVEGQTLLSGLAGVSRGQNAVRVVGLGRRA